MRWLTTICLLLTLTVPSVAQNWFGVCPMQAARHAPATQMDTTTSRRCHTTKPPATNSTLAQCKSSHSCCKVAPGETQFPMRYSPILSAHPDVLVAATIIAPRFAGSAELHLSLRDLVTRPPVQHLKTDLRT